MNININGKKLFSKLKLLYLLCGASCVSSMFFSAENEEVEKNLSGPKFVLTNVKNADKKAKGNLGLQKQSKVTLRVGAHKRTAEDIKYRLKLYAALLNIPEQILSSFLEMKKFNIVTLYTDELRKLELIKKHGKGILHGKEVKAEVAKAMSDTKDLLKSYNVPSYVAKEFFTTQIAFKELSKKLHLGAHEVTDSDILGLKQELKTQLEELKARIVIKNKTKRESSQLPVSYILSEIVLGKKYLHDAEEKDTMVGIINNLLQNGTPLGAVALAFSTSISRNMNGQLGPISIPMLNPELQVKISQARALGQNMVIVPEDRGLVIYVIHGAILENNIDDQIPKDDMLRNIIYQRKIMSYLFALMENADVNHIEYVMNENINDISSARSNGSDVDQNDSKADDSVNTNTESSEDKSEPSDHPSGKTEKISNFM